ncbi:MAG: hypothetical protein ACR2PR_12245 [Pseudohongiellaceae bacterium]
MVIKYMKQTCTSLLMALMVVLPVYGEENSRPCDVNHQISLLALADMDLSGYEKKSYKFRTRHANGPTMDYYYDGDILKAIVSNSGEFYTGRTETTFYFESRENYMYERIKYFYIWPLDRDNFNIVATEQVRFLVCQNKPSPSFVFGGAMDGHYRDSNLALERVLRYAPRAN